MLKHTLRKNGIRSRPKWQVLAQLRAVGLTQVAIAERVQCSPSFVSRVLAHRATLRPSAKTEAIWREIDRAVGGA